MSERVPKNFLVFCKVCRTLRCWQPKDFLDRRYIKVYQWEKTIDLDWPVRSCQIFTEKRGFNEADILHLIGADVRIGLLVELLEKGMELDWSTEIFNPPDTQG